MILSPKPGAHLGAVKVAVPPNVVDVNAAACGLARLFPDEDETFLRNLVERSGVETRHVVPQVSEILNTPGFTARNGRYREEALVLAERACTAALVSAAVAPEEIDVLIDVSCTGITIPALDVDLAPRLGLRRGVRRIPITESGCAAGALAISMAASFAATGLRVLIVAVELCSLTLCPEDRSRTNLIASVLFGDGAAAALVLPGGPGPRIEAVDSYLVPETRAAMGFDIGSHGLRIQLQRELPRILGSALEGVVDGFLADHGRDRGDVGLHLVHPGGRRILDGYEETFQLAPGALRFSRDALRRYGNLSSASILAVLELALDEGVELEHDKEALLVGVGPGLSIELALLRWEGVE